MDSYRSRRLISLALLGPAFLVAGCRKATHITLACEATPSAIYQGEPVTVKATAGSAITKKHTSVLYNWSGAGVTGDGSTAHVTTGALNPGTYTINGEVKEGKPGKEGRKPEQTSTCSAAFKVREFEPPTVSYSANPTTLLPGGNSDIICTGVSPQNRPLTYTYSASVGTINGAGTAALFSAAGAPTGPATVTCNVQDDKNHSAIAEIALMIQAPPPPLPHVQATCSLFFDRDGKHPTRVNNEAKACLDEIALNLYAQPDAKAVLVADSTAKQEQRPANHKFSRIENFAERRAVNAKEYLVKEKGIDPARVAIATGIGVGPNVQDYLVPAGANLSADLQAIEWINESAFTTEERKPLPMRRRGGTPAE